MKFKYKERSAQWIRFLFPEHTKGILAFIGLILIFMCLNLLLKDNSEVNGLKRPEHFEDAVNVPIYYDLPGLGIENQEIQLKLYSQVPNESAVENYLIEMEKLLLENLRDRFEGSEKIDGPIRLATSIGKCKLLSEIHLTAQGRNCLDDTQWVLLRELQGEATMQIQYTLEYQKHTRSGSYKVILSKEHFHKDYEAFYAQKIIEENLLIRAKADSNEILQLEEKGLIESLNGEKIIFKSRAETTSVIRSFLLFLLLIISFILLSHYEKHEKQALILRQKTIELTYFINHFLLMYRTGLTIPKSFAMTTDHRGESLDRNILWLQQFKVIQKGIWSEMSFQDQLQAFISCFDLAEGRRFVRLLGQNMKQGDHLLGVQLEQLSESMWERRIRNARKESEKASTKLIFPMLIIFIVILIVTIVPTFLEVNKYY